jgi:hypothetical protein
MDRADIGAPRRGGGAEYFTLRRPGEEIAAIYGRPVPEPGPRVPITAGGSYVESPLFPGLTVRLADVFDE